MKAQAGMELLIVLAIIFAILTPLWIYVQIKSVESNTVIRTAQARFAVQKIAEASETVYIQGPPAKMKIFVTFPEQLREAHVYQNEVSLTVSSLGGNSDSFWQTSANLSGSLPSTPGVHAVTAEATGTGVVLSSG